ncbi:GSCOCG00001856001-RA-CDS [Cotesia congregata]|nr:GSCOCG00001856001-RA-CDS [Cotesia congregata]
MHCRYKGRFIKKNIAQWKKNVIASNKARNENKESAENTNFIELSGRRLVDLKLLDDELWCKPCNQALRLRHSVNELKNGSASIFQVKCQDVGGKPRIMKRQKIIDSLCTKLRLILSNS